MRLRRMHSLTTCIFFITFIILSVIFLFFKKDSHVAIFISLLLLTQRILRITEENIRHSICQKSSGGGMQGGTWNCPGFPCKQIIVSLICHRRPAGRDPTARRWSPKAKCFKAAAESGVPGFSFMHLHGEVYLFFFVNFRVFRG